jgi:hypothetical protein
VFHFNKKHLEDQTIPMWVLKFHGETYYVNHVECNVPWSTKETPDNNHTKGSIKVKEVLLTIDENNEAKLTNLTIYDKFRLRNKKLGITRIMFRPHSDMHKALQNNEFKHSPFKTISAPCTTSYIICDMLKKEEVTFASLKYDSFRILKENEHYYKQYDETKDDRIRANYSDPDTPFEYS